MEIVNNNGNNNPNNEGLNTTQMFEMEPVVLIDKAKGKEIHIIVPTNYCFQYMMDQARRIYPDLFQGNWQLSYINSATKSNETISADLSVGNFIERGIDTFYWAYQKQSFRVSVSSDQQSGWHFRQKEAVRGQRQVNTQNSWGANVSNVGNVAILQTQGMVAYGDLGKRLVAFLIDLVVLGIMVRMFRGFSAFLVWWLYFALLDSSQQQGTLGKVIMGLKVTDMNGNRIKFGTAAVRGLLKTILSSGFTLGIGLLVAVFTEKRQALHDLLAKTMVVEKN